MSPFGIGHQSKVSMEGRLVYRCTSHHLVTLCTVHPLGASYDLDVDETSNEFMWVQALEGVTLHCTIQILDVPNDSIVDEPQMN